jgi:hypothetical protein
LIDANANDQINSFDDTMNDSDSKQSLKVDVLYNDEFIKEYRNATETHSSLISSDIVPLLKETQLNNKSTNTLKIANDKITNLKLNIEKKSNDLKFLKDKNKINDDFSLKLDCEKTFDSFKTNILKTNKHLNEFKDFIFTIQEPNLSVNDENFDILGEKFKEIMELMKYFDKVNLKS